MLNERINLNKNYIDNEVAESLSPELKKVWDEMYECRSELETILKSKDLLIGRGDGSATYDVPLAAYMLIKASESSDPYTYNFKDDVSIDAEIIEVVSNTKIESLWSELVTLIKKHDTNIFYLVANLKNLDAPMITPEGICLLAEKILDVKAGDKVADLGCGTGTVALDIKKKHPEAKVYAVDIMIKEIAMAKMHNSLLNENITFEVRDMFQLASDERMRKSFDKIFSNYPFRVDTRNLNQEDGYLDGLKERIPAMSKATSSDWIFNALMLDLISENGKAVGIMTNGGTWNMLDAQVRKYFVENGYIECVIALPKKLFNSTSVATSMVVLSYGNEKGIRLVDASQLYNPGRRTNELSDSDISKILDAVSKDGEISKFVDIDTLRKNDYVLSFSRYAVMPEDIEDGRTFKEVIKRITRGAPLSARALDEISSQVPTNMQYLMLANIQNGFIDKDLPYLKEIEKKNEKYCLTDRCLILSKNGYPYKVAVAEVKDDQKIMANGNLYIIELNEEQVDPYYLAAFFISDQGIASLKRITVGATIPNIGVEQLKALVIPIPSLDKQRKIAEDYQTAKDEIEMLQLKLEKAKDRMAHAFDGKEEE